MGDKDKEGRYLDQCEEMKRENMWRFIETGETRLSSRNESTVEFVDYDAAQMLLGCLGGMGVGQMWFPLEGERDLRRAHEAVEAGCPHRGTRPEPEEWARYLA